MLEIKPNRKKKIKKLQSNKEKDWVKEPLKSHLFPIKKNKKNSAEEKWIV